MSHAATISTRDVAAPTKPSTPATAKRTRVWLRRALMLGGVAVVAAGSLAFWLQGGRYVSADDAYMQADKLAMTTDVSGIVAEIPVHEGQEVHKGDVLFRLDPQKFQIALDGARANLAEVALNMDAMKHDYQRLLLAADAATTQVSMDQARFDRSASLVGGGDVSRQVYDDARFRLQADQQAVDTARMAAQVQLAKLGGKADVEISKTPAFLLAQAQVGETRRQLDHSIVRASFDGVVTQVAQLQPGMFLAADTAAFGLVSTDHVWAEANLKETELTYVKPGDHVGVSVDTYPGRTWDGVVQSIAPASGNEFAILPAQNSSGNWVKVVQRISVRVRVDQKPTDPPLRAGMSVVTDIDTGHHRTLADLL